MSGLSPMVMERFLNPTHGGSLPAFSGEGWAGSVKAYRFVRIQVELEEDRIVAAAFGTTGCAPAIAAGEWVCAWAEGRTCVEALTLAADTVRDALGGLPDPRRYCADLAVEALHSAILSVSR